MDGAYVMYDTTTDQHARSNVSVFILSGFIQGLACRLALAYWPQSNQLQTAFITAAMIGIVIFCFILQMSVSEQRRHGNLPAALGIGGLFALLALWYILQLPDTTTHPNSWKGVVTLSSILSGTLLFYFMLPFVQSWPDREHGCCRYTDLFRHSWDNFFVLLVAVLLTGAYWLLIVLWVMLFKMVGIPLFKDIFFNATFAWLSLPVVFALGIRIGLTHDRIITALRRIVLSLCGWLMPLLALITLLFGASLPFTGLTPVWDTGYSTPILLCLIGANIVLLNGIFQDGSNQVRYPSPLLRLIEIAILLLPVFAILGAYSTWLRIDQYGLSPKRIYLVLLLVITCSYSFAYAFAVFRKNKPWMGAIRPANTAIALLVCLSIILVHSPLINPVAVSTRYQLHRLFSGRIEPEKFDFGALKFQFGIPGIKALQKLADLPADTPLMKKITAQLAAVNKADSYYSWKKQQGKKQHSTPPKFTLLGNDNISLQGLAKAIEQEQCQIQPCVLYPVDLDKDNQKEMILIDTRHYYHQMVLFARDDNGNWQKQGFLGDEIGPENQKKLVEVLKTVKVRPVPARYQSLQIGTTVYHFAPEKLTETVTAKKTQ